MQLKAINSILKSTKLFYSTGAKVGFGPHAAYRQKDLDYSHVVHVKSTINNTHIVLVDAEGDNVLVKSTAGLCGLKGAARSTSDAGFQTAMNVAQKAKDKGIYPSGVHLILKGFGAGRDQVMRALNNVGWPVSRISDATPIIIGGCRPRKKRRV